MTYHFRYLEINRSHLWENISLWWGWLGLYTARHHVIFNAAGMQGWSHGSHAISSVKISGGRSAQPSSKKRIVGFHADPTCWFPCIPNLNVLDISIVEDCLYSCHLVLKVFGGCPQEERPICFDTSPANHDWEPFNLIWVTFFKFPQNYVLKMPALCQGPIFQIPANKLGLKNPRSGNNSPTSNLNFQPFLRFLT